MHTPSLLISLVDFAHCFATIPLAAQPRWQQADYILAQDDASAAFDAARGRLVCFAAPLGQTYAETLEWDGTRWDVRRRASSPSRRLGHSLVYDVTRQRCVLFGGALNATYYADVWEWDGANWMPKPPNGAAPSPRLDHAAAYDSARQRMVVFGGLAFASYSNETWEWDGTSWAQASPATVPPARRGHLMAYDPVRQRTVLHGGRTPTQLFDTWEWDGTNWQQVITTNSPQTNGGMAITYDPQRARVVVAAGFSSTTLWEWDGVNWAVRTTTGAPAARVSRVFAYDTARQALVFGFGSVRDSRVSDTWEQSSGTSSWVERAPMSHPPQRFGAGIAYDETRGQVILQGGAILSGLADTWAWDGASWSRLATAGPAQWGHSLAYDSVRGVLLSAGGSNGRNWQWDGTSWTELQTAARPSARTYASLTFDRRRGRAVLFGGDALPTPLNDTWEWDGTNWTQRTLGAAPSPRYGAAMCYDAVRGVTVLYGGRNATQTLRETWEYDGTTWRRNLAAQPPFTGLGQVMVFDGERGRSVLMLTSGGYWEWDGVAWTQRSASPQPSNRSGAHMAYDTRRGRTVLFGGETSAVTNVDTWELSHPSDVIGAGQTVARLSFRCTTPPVLGGNCCLTFPTLSGSGYVLLSPGTPVLPPVELNLPLFCSTARIYVDLGTAVGLFSAGNPSTVCLPLPADPNLLHAPLAAQGFALDPAACVRTGDGVSLRVHAP